ncbi:GIY-YIG nuclease family protein [Pandoraea pulmonicola]|nr:GIY-YIG nuclease family protein [Pandoraea pulmonicola]
MTLTKPSDFLSAVQLFCDELPEITPEKWGWWEPLDCDFDRNNLRDLIPGSGISETVYWQRKKLPKSEGSFAVRWRSKSPAVSDTHARIGFTVELKQIEQASLVSYIKNASTVFSADIAFFDVLTPEYTEFSVESGSAPYGDRLMVVTHLLRHWLPDIFWATVLGPPYVRIFGKDRLLSAPAYAVEDLGPETVYVQLTKNLADAYERGSELQLARNSFKEHLRSNAFFVEGKGYDRLQKGAVGDVFEVPKFDLVEDE